MNGMSRLLNVKEFQEYAGGIGRNSALNLAQKAEVRIKIGRRLLIDREKFDAWLDSQTGK